MDLESEYRRRGRKSIATVSENTRMTAVSAPQSSREPISAIVDRQGNATRLRLPDDDRKSSDILSLDLPLAVNT
jgi:hypothetical protein